MKMTAPKSVQSPEPDRPPRSLAEAPLALARIRPRLAAPRQEWLAYYQRSAAWYAEIAETDRGHHHEALFLAGEEGKYAMEIAAQIQAGMGGEGGEQDGDTGAADVDGGS
ncbi:MAG: AMED_5909 family protein [Pseudonocardiaceae bacterium]